MERLGTAGGFFGKQIGAEHAGKDSRPKASDGTEPGRQKVVPIAAAGSRGTV